MTKRPLIILIVLFLILSMGSAFGQENMKFIKSPAFKHPQRPPAVFEHDKHNEKAQIYDCSVCHHYYENGKLIQGAVSVGQPCSACHKLHPTKDNKIPLMEAYHKLCISCHKKEGKGPLACGQCHVIRKK